MNIQDQFVTYDLAVKLKELGFSGNTLGYYGKGGGFCYSIFQNEQTEIITLAPLWQQAFDWMLSNHQILGEIHYDYVLFSYTVHDPHTDTDFRLCQSLNDDTPDEELLVDMKSARTACLEKMIEILKERL